MAFVFDCTQKSTTQTSYVCVQEADDYFDGDPRQAKWSNLGQAEKEQYLTASTNRLDMEEYGGEKTDDNQALEWPRRWILKREEEGVVDESTDIDYYDPDVVPRQMKIATFELAMWLLEEYNEEPMVSRVDMERMTEYSVGPLSVKMRNVKRNELPDIVKRALKAIGPNAWKGNISSIKLVR